jgi:endonuclease/exonuclease/phosphatase (EEP) superfamily protein YafD
VETPQGNITIWNVHPSTAISQERWNLQHGQIMALTHAIAEFKGGPLIVAGDFNTTPQSDNFQLVAQYLHNAHHEGGQGFGFSFPAQSINIPNKTINLQWKLLSFSPIREAVKWLGAKPEPLFKYHKNLQLPSGSLVRIDQIFYNDHFTVRQAQTLTDSGGSDHLPIIAELVLVK